MTKTVINYHFCDNERGLNKLRPKSPSTRSPQQKPIDSYKRLPGRSEQFEPLTIILDDDDDEYEKESAKEAANDAKLTSAMVSRAEEYPPPGRFRQTSMVGSH